MPSRLTVNADSQFMPDVGVFLAFIQRLQPDYVFVMDDAPQYKLSAQIHAVAPHALIIQRQYIPVDRNNPAAGGYEGSLWKVPNGNGVMSPDDFLDAFCAPNDQPYYIHNAGNEPLPKGDDLRNCLAWFVELMHRGKARNIRLCLGNFQTVGYETNEIESGVWDEYLKTLAKYKGFHFAGWHEYSLAILPNGCMGQPDSNLITPPYGTVNYPSAQAFAANPFKHAHMGRYLRFVVRAKTIGAYPFESIFTEIGWDRTVREGDLIRRIDDICDEPALGINSLGKLWKLHQPALTADMAAWLQLRWLDEVYTDDVKALCFYDWTRQPEWAEFSIHEHQELFGYWYRYADAQRNTPNTPPDVPTPIPTTPPPVLFLATPTVAAPTALNVRTSPNGQITDTVKPGETVSVIAPENASALIGVQDKWVQVVSPNGVTGWCAAWLLKRVEPPKPTEPHAWQKFLTEPERSVYSRAKAGDLSLIESTMLKMGALLDEAYKGK